MRTLVAIGLMLMCGVTAAQEPIDSTKLLGSWDQPGDKAKKQLRLIVEFVDVTKAKFKYGEESNNIVEFKYTVAKNKITLTQKTRDGDFVRTFFVTKLTPEVLDAVEDGGEKFSFKRLKEEKKEPPKEEKK